MSNSCTYLQTPAELLMVQLNIATIRKTFNYKPSKCSPIIFIENEDF